MAGMFFPTDEDFEDVQGFRSKQLKLLPKVMGVYLLRDATGRPLYVGQGEDIRDRLNKHLSAARSDLISQRRIDLLDVGYVSYWLVCPKRHKVGLKQYVDSLESYIYHSVNQTCPLINSQIPKQVPGPFLRPSENILQILPDSVLAFMSNPTMRFKRKKYFINCMLDYMAFGRNSRSQQKCLETHCAQWLEVRNKILTGVKS